MQATASSTIDMTANYPSSEELSDDYFSNATRFTVDFLTAVQEHVIKTLGGDQHYGASFKSLRIQWIMTVPAVWSHEAKSVTKQCALAAGMGPTLLMISEPEAAAVYALRKLGHHHLRVGNHLIVLDAGGGTVDLISYRIRELTPILRVEESGSCTGGKCGGVFVNRVFESMINKKLQSAGQTLSEDALFELRRNFERFVWLSPRSG
jgi:hypothetical protein